MVPVPLDESYTKLLRSHSGSGVRDRLLRLTYALLSLLSRVLTNGSNKAFAVAHTDSGFMPSSSALVAAALALPLAVSERVGG